MTRFRRRVSLVNMGRALIGESAFALADETRRQGGRYDECFFCQREIWMNARESTLVQMNRHQDSPACRRRR